MLCTPYGPGLLAIAKLLGKGLETRSLLIRDVIPVPTCAAVHFSRLFLSVLICHVKAALAKIASGVKTRGFTKHLM